MRNVKEKEEVKLESIGRIGIQGREIIAKGREKREDRYLNKGQRGG